MPGTCAHADAWCNCMPTFVPSASSLTFALQIGITLVGAMIVYDVLLVPLAPVKHGGWAGVVRQRKWGR